MTGPIDELLGTVGPHPSFAPAGPVRFSVVVRTQGTRPNSLREALESLANQTHQAHQVLVMVHTDDDHVTGEVRALTANINTVVEICQVASGLRTAPLNAGLDAATGDYVCFLDDDDLARPDWLSAFDLAIQDHPGQIARARTGVQQWSTEGTGEPRHPQSQVDEPFAATLTCSRTSATTRPRFVRSLFHSGLSATTEFNSPPTSPCLRTGTSSCVSRRYGGGVGRFPDVALPTT